MMFEYFMRVEIRESVDESGESDEKRTEGLAAIQRWMDEHRDYMDELSSIALMRGELTNTNGVDLVIAFGCRNHENGIVAKLRELLEHIATVAPGSFGFVYYMDANYYYFWNVLVLKRGQITEEEDPFFSPMIPTVEDASDYS